MTRSSRHKSHLYVSRGRIVAKSQIHNLSLCSFLMKKSVLPKCVTFKTALNYLVKHLLNHFCQSKYQSQKYFVSLLTYADNKTVQRSFHAKQHVGSYWVNNIDKVSQIMIWHTWSTRCFVSWFRVLKFSPFFRLFFCLIS